MQGLRYSAQAAASLLVLSWCASAYQPLPWDEPEGPSHLYGISPRSDVGRRLGRVRYFGSAGLYFDWHVRLEGDIGGISDGAGFSLEIPATLPAWLLYGLLVDPVAVFAPLAAETWSSGLAGEGLRTSPLLDEVSFDFFWSRSSHQTESLGDLEYNRYALGLRVGGPAGANWVRAGLSVGCAWHDLNFDAGGRKTLFGPYAALGLDLRPFAEAGLSIRFQARWDWASGLDDTGGVLRERAFAAGAGVVFSW